MPRRIPRVVMGVGSLLVSFGWLSGCASTDTGQIVFTKAGVSAADHQKDENDCLRSSVGVDDQTRILVPFQVDRHAFRSCMEGRGYAATPVK
jgi:hypothetical protein